MTPAAIRQADGGLERAELETGGEPPSSAYDVRHILTSADETADANWTVVQDAWTTGGGTLSEDVIATGLTNGMEYDVQVRAENSVGNGDWSPTMMGTLATKPGAPTISTVADGGYGSLTVSWSVPAPMTGGTRHHRLRCTPHPDQCRPTRQTPTGPWWRPPGRPPPAAIWRTPSPA